MIYFTSQCKYVMAAENLRLFLQISIILVNKRAQCEHLMAPHSSINTQTSNAKQRNVEFKIISVKGLAWKRDLCMRWWFSSWFVRYDVCVNTARDLPLAHNSESWHRTYGEEKRASSGPLILLPLHPDTNDRVVDTNC